MYIIMYYDDRFEFFDSFLLQNYAAKLLQADRIGLRFLIFTSYCEHV